MIMMMTCQRGSQNSTVSIFAPLIHRWETNRCVCCGMIVCALRSKQEPSAVAVTVTLLRLFARNSTALVLSCYAFFGPVKIASPVQNRSANIGFAACFAVVFLLFSRLANEDTLCVIERTRNV